MTILAQIKGLELVRLRTVHDMVLRKPQGVEAVQQVEDLSTHAHGMAELWSKYILADKT